MYMPNFPFSLLLIPEKMSSTSRRMRRHSPSVVVQSIPNRSFESQPDCRICKRDHPLRTCQRFNRLNVTARIKIIKQYKYCRNCLAHSHQLRNCRSSVRCHKCNKKHHTLLHQRQDVRRTSNQINLHGVSTASATLLPTVLIRLDFGKEWRNIRGVLDPSSEVTKIADFLPKRYRFPIKKSGTLSLCKLTFKPYFGNTPIFVINAELVNTLPQKTRSRDLDERVAEPYKNLVLADPDFFKSCEINVILGADIYGHLIKANITPPTLTTPLVQDTILGWTLIGKIRP